MNKKIVFGILTGVLLVSLLASVSAFQLRPMNQIDHPGLTSPYNPPAEGPNHRGVSDYASKWMGISELCEPDWQIRPANQGLNILRFFTCNWGE